MIVISILAGLALLGLGGEALVRGSSTAALRLRVSPLFVGIVFVGFGTSVPELTTSIAAALDGSPGIALGNVVGSNIANLSLVLGVGAIMAPVLVRGGFRLNGLVMILSTGLFALVVLAFGVIDRWMGVAFLGLLGLYLLVAARSENRAGDPGDAAPAAAAPSLLAPLLVALAGLAAVIVGAGLLVDGATVLAGRLGLSETVIGLTVVAVGTSLPELATTIVASIRRQADVAIGNVVGSCIFNILGIVGLTAIVAPLDIPAEIGGFDLWVLIGATALAATFAITGRRIGRIEGAVLLVGYAAYTTALLVPGFRPG